jgi:hypothetical protein
MPIQASESSHWKWNVELVFQALLVFLAISAFAAVGFEFYRDNNKDLGAWSILIALCVFVVTERIAAIISHYLKGDRERELDRMWADLKSELDGVREDLTSTLENICKDLRNTILSKSDIFDLGLPADGLRWVSNALNGDAVHVRDLMVRANKNASFADKKAYTTYLEDVEQFLERGYAYIVLGNDSGLLASDSWIIEHYDKHDRVNYVRRVTRDDIHFPIVNCVIIDHKDRRKEVLFGWDFDNTDVCHVFLSRSPALIRYFETLFAACLTYSKEWSPSLKLLNGNGSSTPSHQLS